MPGFTATDKAVNGQQVFGGFLASHYHKPSDDLSLPMDLAAVERFARANLAVARAIADDPVDPAWKPGNFFGKLFGKGRTGSHNHEGSTARRHDAPNRIGSSSCLVPSRLRLIVSGYFPTLNV